MLRKDYEKYQKGCKKAQLFLCSRDIHQGDRITFDGVRFEECVSNTRGYFTDHPDWFKVVGLISPNATWIKEGDDILSKNVHRAAYRVRPDCTCSTIDHEEDAEEWDNSDLAEGWTKCYLIEGPCGHFH